MKPIIEETFNKCEEFIDDCTPEELVKYERSLHIDFPKPIEEDSMTVREFCRHKTQALELCIIRENRWIVHSVWIDYEDLFVLSDKYANKEVKSTEWGTITIVNQNGNKMEIPCHYIDV